ncbi:MAG TPA: malic enzyme-like NAD(P)-binding protein, partial [Gemmatimonadaceae bacterium]|nr:malic enzyme-like NAD(P)-binding protein [Gemmatimonadaceae bacterium]
GEKATDLVRIIECLEPTVLVGTTGTAGTFHEGVIRAMADRCERPVVMPLSNPTAVTEARPGDVIGWTGGRALVATGSPFPPVTFGGETHEIGQANNVFVFPGLGLGAIVAEATHITDAMVLAAARALAAAVTPERLACGALYPSVRDLRSVSRSVAIAVGREAIESGHAGGSPETLEAEVDAAMWWPQYVPYQRG